MGTFSFNNIFSDIKISGMAESVLPPLILNMSITGGVVILFVLLARLVLKKAPKVFSYALWAVVLFRLLCPVSITTDFSLLKLFDAPVVENTQHTTAVEYIPYDVVHTQELEVRLPVPQTVNEAVNEVLPQEHAALGADPLEGEFAVGSMLWVLGMVAMAVYSVASYILLRYKLIGAVLLQKNIYLADGIATPFVMGLIRPKIYLPSALSEQEQGYIILHEQHHIRRGDHIIKVLAFLALCIHWFNPLVWVAFVLASKDMEMSCDEAVVKKLGESIRTDYSASLLSLATGRRIIAGTPLAFGEGDTRSRIKNMLNWKQAKPAVMILASVTVVLALMVCGTNAAKSDESASDDASDLTEGTSDVTEPNNIADTNGMANSNNMTDTNGMANPNSMADTNGMANSNNMANANGKSETKGLAEDLAYYLELAADTEFQDMNQERQAGILEEYKDLLENYTVIARESTDGKAAYIVGYSNVEPEQSSLHGMYGVELSEGEEEVFQFLYREEEAEIVEAVMAENKTDFPTTVGYRIENSRILWSSYGESLLIQPNDIELLLDVPYNRCLYTPNGREYIVDAVSRGIDVCGKTDTYLYVYRMSEEFGEIAERIALTEAEVKAIQEEELVNIPEGFGFAATLHMDGKSDYYGEHSGVPQTILDLAIEKCDYRFEDPSMISDTVLEARLDCDWLEYPIYANADDITRLQEILKNAEFGGVGGCGYGAKLSLTFADGEKMTVFKGCDDCDTIVFGSYGGYFLGDKENTEFWEIFGLDPKSKLPKEN